MLSVLVRPLFPAACSLPALCPSGVVGSPRLACRLSGRAAGRVSRAVGRCDGACRSSLVLRVGCRTACLRSSSRGSVRAAGRLPLRGSSRLIDAGGEIGFLCLLGWSGECGDYVNYRLSVDCFGTGVYINTRALIGFSFRCFLARACCVGGFSVLLLPPIALVYAPMNWFLRGTNGSDFFLPIFISSHLIARLLCLLICFLLPGYSHIHTSPLLAPLPSTRRTGRSWLRYG